MYFFYNEVFFFLLCCLLKRSFVLLLWTFGKLLMGASACQGFLACSRCDRQGNLNIAERELGSTKYSISNVLDVTEYVFLLII